MIVNGRALLSAAPIVGMLHEKRKEHGVSYGLTEAGYDIRIAEDIVFEPHFYNTSQMNITVRSPLLREPVTSVGPRFTLASAIEEFDMPALLVGVVHDKSSWARRGLSVLNTVIEPGWRGFLTLELVYHGAERLHIPAGAGIAQVLFHDIGEPAYYCGKYQDQQAGAVPARFE